MRYPVVFIVAHSDDHVIGGGGVIQKYVREGAGVFVIVLSYGELSHPWLKREVTHQMRVREARQAGVLLGCKTRFYNLKEFSFLEGFPAIRQNLVRLLRRCHPHFVYTHSSEDKLHPDHVAAAQITAQLLAEAQLSPETYSFMIWTPATKQQKPQVYVDITHEFSKKLKAMLSFKSQRWNAIYPLLPGVIIKSIKDGLHASCLFAERFTREK